MNYAAVYEQHARTSRAHRVVCEQVGCSQNPAIALMVDRGFVAGRTLEQVAGEVLERTIRFDA